MTGTYFCANADKTTAIQDLTFWQDRLSMMLYNFRINGQGAIHDR
jgi:hypothetical protein